MAEPDLLDVLVERLERAAVELRSGALDADRAASLVDDCARIAAEAGAELDRQVRMADQNQSRPTRAGQLALES